MVTKTGTERAPESTSGLVAKRATLSARTLAALKAGEWATAAAARGEGVLQARRLRSGSVAFYLRTTAKAGHRIRVPLGIGISLAKAKELATTLSLRYQQGERDLRAALAADERELKRKREANEAAENAAKEATATNRTRTLGALLDAYADQLQRDGKSSARSVRSELHHHIKKKWPKLWAMPITDVTTDDLLIIVAAPTENGHLRQAEKVRSYLRAAFAAGMKARHNAKALPTLRNLRVAANPARDLAPIEGANKARDRALSLAELRAYWKRIRDVPNYAALRLHLLTGCQRIEQLARTMLSDVDADSDVLCLLDRKGRRSEPRQHIVPLLPAAIDAIRAMDGGAAGPHLFTVTAGKSGASYFTIRDRISEVVQAMLTAGELPGGAFTPGDLRRTVETRLAAVGIPENIRGQLQSHGLSGVQNRHYDRYKYLDEKRAALETLYGLLTRAKARVVPIKRTATS
jgi:hypothetical protein